MADWLSRLLGREPKSADRAKERLKLVLIHDRTDLPPGLMDSLKDEMISVISKYIDIDPQGVKITMAQEGREQRLVADIPVRPNRRRD
jgi:cell division topological specificity factor